MSEYLSLKSFVNEWECDENVHMNVQFYAAKFDDADRIFQFTHGIERSLPRTRHIRYHSEMRGAEMIEIHSAIVESDLAPLVIQHRMIEPISGRLTATSLDVYPNGKPVNGRCIQPIPAALPRSSPGLPYKYTLDREELDRRSALTFRGIIHPKDCDSTGVAVDRAYVQCFTDGAAHSWEFGGLTKEWLDKNNLGRVAVEMKLTIFEPLKSGDLVEQRSMYVAVTEKSFTFVHHIFDMSSNKLVASGETTGVTIDLEKRRVVPLLKAAREKILSSLA